MQSSFTKEGIIGPPQTTRGYNLDEVISAIQKEIRRGNEYQAVYWALELESFNNKALWNRLKVIATEDIGLANPTIPLLIFVLEKNYFDTYKKKNNLSKLFLTHAILLLSRSPKSRIVDDLLSIISSDIKDVNKRIEIPEYALDIHTYRGRKMGRGIKHFLEEGAKILNEKGENPYKKLAKERVLNKEEKQSKQ